jgi:hypothetical protein
MFYVRPGARPASRHLFCVLEGGRTIVERQFFHRPGDDIWSQLRELAHRLAPVLAPGRTINVSDEHSRILVSMGCQTLAKSLDLKATQNRERT